MSSYFTNNETIKQSGILHIVPTPIGNLEDITMRALRVLSECDLVVCENIKRSLKLLSYFKISKPLISLNSYSKFSRANCIIDKLLSGDKIAVVSSAGTPCISDPGNVLIKLAIKKCIKIDVLPGPSAVITALVGSGLPTNGFVFCGFFKKKSGKIRNELYKFKNLKKTIIFYESPYRIIKTLEICKDIFGENVEICVAREMTKKFEEFIRGPIENVLESIKSKSDLLGEFVVLIYYNYKIMITK